MVGDHRHATLYNLKEDSTTGNFLGIFTKSFGVAIMQVLIITYKELFYWIPYFTEISLKTKTFKVDQKWNIWVLSEESNILISLPCPLDHIGRRNGGIIHYR